MGGRCESCRHWQNVDLKGNGSRLRLSIGRCTLISSHPDFDYDWDKSRAVALTADGEVGAELVTQAGFSCSEWQAKDTD